MSTIAVYSLNLYSLKSQASREYFILYMCGWHRDQLRPWFSKPWSWKVSISEWQDHGRCHSEHHELQPDAGKFTPSIITQSFLTDNG